MAAKIGIGAKAGEKDISMELLEDLAKTPRERRETALAAFREELDDRLSLEADVLHPAYHAARGGNGDTTELFDEEERTIAALLLEAVRRDASDDKAFSEGVRVIGSFLERHAAREERVVKDLRSRIGDEELQHLAQMLDGN